MFENFGGEGNCPVAPLITGLIETITVIVCIIKPTAKKQLKALGLLQAVEESTEWTPLSSLS